MSNKVYVITNLDGYSTQMRHKVAQSILENYSEDLNEYITVPQIKNLVYQSCLGTDIEDNPFIDENTNEQIAESIKIWIYNASLSKLAALNKIECAWNNDLNEMVFWASTSTKTDKSDETTNKNSKA